MTEFEGRVAVVTGAASGIGLALAQRFGRERMKLVLADLEQEPLGRARDALAAAGVEVLAVRADVSRAAEVEALAQSAFERFGTVDLLFNNAGVGAGGPAWELEPADWEWILGVNLWGVVHGIRAFVPRMIEQGQGHVVNTASFAGLVSAPGMSAYCASKHAVVALSECLHHDLSVATGGKVKVSVLCPSWVKTNIADSERNRPASSAGRRRSARERIIQSMMRSTVAAGLAPAEVAEQVFGAVVEGRFWILTHKSTEAAILARTNEILEGRAPEFEGLREG
jgi:NAD(P)-dependent dehydrogenase (short-subunit alcohol dehydrogenase family)